MFCLHTYPFSDSYKLVFFRLARQLQYQHPSCAHFLLFVYLSLQGHAGVTMMSPLEQREISDPRKVLCVFGRSPDGLPHKVIQLLAADRSVTRGHDSRSSITHDDHLFV